MDDMCVWWNRVISFQMKYGMYYLGIIEKGKTYIYIYEEGDSRQLRELGQLQVKGEVM